jgi:hypothetical protein
MMRQNHSSPGHFQIGNFFDQGIDGKHWKNRYLHSILNFGGPMLTYESRVGQAVSPAGEFFIALF